MFIIKIKFVSKHRYFGNYYTRIKDIHIFQSVNLLVNI